MKCHVFIPGRPPWCDTDWVEYVCDRPDTGCSALFQHIGKHGKEAGYIWCQQQHTLLKLYVLAIFLS